MEDIAKETGVSRASLYGYFENKEEIFRCLSAQLHERSLADAETHLKGDASIGLDLASRVAAALLARLTPFLEVVAQSAHGSEIYDENNRLCGDLVLASSERFVAMLTTALSKAVRTGEIDLKAAGLTAPATAELVHLGAAGLKQGAGDIATVEKRVRSFVSVFFAGLQG
ncbi:MAG: AcrR family transcriptional regulator [Myxococcota bacterium]|jgi:AcrR family transcriptional regulator